jgi:uncharacterized protein YbjQ (UPF0145 family)
VSKEPPSELERVRAESLKRLRRGQLPVEAERRLQALGARPDFFTSDLSVSEFALGRELELRPVSQVMGSCVYHVGLRADQAWYGWAPGEIHEVQRATEAWNSARQIALRRLQLEAAECGAGAVVGVEIQHSEKDYAANSVEFTSIGTAVRVPGVKPTPKPSLTDLSAQEYWLLWRRGYAALGVVGHTSVVGCVPDVQTQRAQQYRRLATAGRVNRELEVFGRGIQAAVSSAVDGMRRGAESLRAAGIVGVRIDRSQVMVERENPSTTGTYGRRAPGAPAHREDLIVTVHAIGTAVALSRAGAARPARFQIEPVRNLRAKGDRAS